MDLVQVGARADSARHAYRWELSRVVAPRNFCGREAGRRDREHCHGWPHDREHGVLLFQTAT